MSLYNTTAFGPPFSKVERIQTQTQQHLFGSLDSKTQPFLFNVTSVSLADDVATLGVSIKSGGGPSSLVLPQVGAVCGVQGTQTNAGIFNVDPATVTAVDYNPATGTGTISYALTGDDVAQTTDVGSLVVHPAEIPDLVEEGSASKPLSTFYGPDEADNARSVFCEAVWSGTIPTSATVVLQVANVNQDSRFQTVQNYSGTAPGGSVAASDALATVADGAVTQSGAFYNYLCARFIRAKVLAMDGGDDTTGLVVTIFA